MTNRIKSLTVALTHDIREDDCEVIVNAIKMIRGVADVDMNVSDIDDYTNRKQVKEELREKMLKWLKDL